MFYNALLLGVVLDFAFEVFFSLFGKEILRIVKRYTTLCGGSLGSRVDEERSKLRELM